MNYIHNDNLNFTVNLMWDQHWLFNTFSVSHQQETQRLSKQCSSPVVSNETLLVVIITSKRAMERERHLQYGITQETSFIIARLSYGKLETVNEMLYGL